MTRIGLIGTGFVARGIAWRVGSTDGMEISGVLTRRPLASVSDFPDSLLTNSANNYAIEVGDNDEIVAEYQGPTASYKAFKYAPEEVADLVAD